ncbi:protein of unknown function (plasmid) [Nitratireductor aquimarinus]
MSPAPYPRSKHAKADAFQSLAGPLLCRLDAAANSLYQIIVLNKELVQHTELVEAEEEAAR